MDRHHTVLFFFTSEWRPMEVRRQLCSICSILVHSEGFGVFFSTVNGLLLSLSFIILLSQQWLETFGICWHLQKLSNPIQFWIPDNQNKAVFFQKNWSVPAQMISSTHSCPNETHEVKRRCLVIQWSIFLSGFLIHYNRFLVKWS